ATDVATLGATGTVGGDACAWLGDWVGSSAAASEAACWDVVASSFGASAELTRVPLVGGVATCGIRVIRCACDGCVTGVRCGAAGRGAIAGSALVCGVMAASGCVASWRWGAGARAADWAGCL